MKDMKQIYNTMVAAMLFCAGFTSCEMKDELLGKGEVPTETGLVELGVAVNDNSNIITKSAEDGGEEQGSSVDPADYPVTFSLKEAEFTKDYIYSDIKGKEIELPIGTYTVVSHTPGELEKKMDHPYYGGESKLEVTKGVTSQATVVCKMKNSRILLTYDDTFTSKFQTWTITIDDGSEQVLTYTEKDGTTLQPVYWLISENCTAIEMKVTATNTAGETVRESRKITKPDGAANNNWVGGDALTINVEPGPDNPEEPAGVSGIKISIKAFFETEKDEIVEVPIEGDDNTPTDPDGGDGEDGDGETTEDKPTMILPQNGSISYSLKELDMPTTANVEISVPVGMKSLKAWITAGNEDFDAVIQDLANYSLDFIDEGVEMVDNQVISGVLSIFAPGTTVNVPTSGTTEYSFPIHSFFALMNMYKETAPNAHVFKLRLEDNEGNIVEKELKVTINP